MIPNDLHYHFSVAVYLLIAGPFLFAALWKLYFFRKKTLNSFAAPNILKEVLIPRSRYNFWAKTIALCSVWILATLALMQPRGNGYYPPEAAAKHQAKEREAIVRRKAHDVIFLVDASASMEISDTRIKTSRLEFAKEIVDEIISRLKGESVALLAFTSDTSILSPLTMDYFFVRLMLRQMRINEGDLAGTNLEEALKDARDFYFSDFTPKLKTLIILTDGGDNALDGLKGRERENQIDKILDLVKDAEKNQLKTITIGMGTEKGREVPGITYEGKPVISSLDAELLEKLSLAGGGHYYFSNNWTATALADNITSRMNETAPPLEEYKVMRKGVITKGEEDLVYQDFFQYPLALALLLLAVALYFPDTRIPKKNL